MPETRAEELVKSVEKLLTEKEAVLAKEKDLVTNLDAVLRKMGYEVVPRTEDPLGRRQAARVAGRWAGGDVGCSHGGGDWAAPQAGERGRTKSCKPANESLLGEAEGIGREG